MGATIPTSWPPASLVGSGMTKTLNVGGSRFGTWSAKAFAPTSYVQTTVSGPTAQLSFPPNYFQGPGYPPAASPNPLTAAQATASPMSPKSPTFWAIGAIVFLSVVYILKRKGTVK